MADPITAKGGFLKTLKNNMGLKLVIIVILVLLFLIPVAFLKTLVGERAGRQEEVRNEIVGQWGGEGLLAGPFLVVTYEVPVVVFNDVSKMSETTWQTHQFIQLPGLYRIDGDLRVEERKRGIFKVPVYTAELGISGDFSTGEITDFLASRGYRAKEAMIVISLGSNRGISSITDLKYGGQEYPFQAGGATLNLFQGEIIASVPLPAESKTIPFSLNMTLKGGRAFTTLPLGKETRVYLTSDWPAPSFNGAFLPEKREYGEDGFQAEWVISHISRNTPGSFPEGWTDPYSSNLLEGTFGVQLFQAVDQYTRNERAIKYGILFVLIPFITFFLFEILTRKRIHPFQYFLSGAANIIFYLLLLSLSEHVGFNGAYLISAAAITALMTFYAFSVLGEKKKGILMLPIQLFSWLYLYFSLQSEDYALLIGATGLFLILVFVMFITRKIRWYQD
jgi:inner membrane protein